MEGKQIAAVVLLIIGLVLALLSVIGTIIVNRKSKHLVEGAKVSKQEEIRGLVLLGGIIVGLVLVLVAIFLSK